MNKLGRSALIVAFAAWIGLTVGCAGKKEAPGPDDLDPKFSMSSYIEDGSLVALIVGTRPARSRETRDYIPLEIGIANHALPGLTLTRESFTLVDENGNRYPAVGRDELSRGDVLVAPGHDVSTRVFDAWVQVLSDAPCVLEEGQRVHVHHGTASVLARLRLPEPGTIEPGQEGACQLRLEEPLALLPGDRFIARFEPGRDKESAALVVKNWWWETGVSPSEAMRVDVRQCFDRFLRYLGAHHVQIDDETAERAAIGWLASAGR